ncbi:TorF family putative porin [Brevundimonas sp. NIBR11]|uniref:TorF family putative porin n=1 Tax=Brevundimonas sp. NIBR11 TaxID=3015999 RepID=UPI0022F12E6E|nr:TorF family putative porin [Brevundimonas sp. NIBR11]WGM30667.1 hypothetical protein KKHFBJBL_00897 [Brevundimonas sp. NIBR11]
MIRPLSLAALALVVLTPTLAQAQTSGDWSFALGATTDNRSKDASKSAGDPSISGLAEWSTADGLFYAGPAFETIRSSTGSDLEVSLLAGVRPEVMGFEVDLNVEHKWLVDAAPGSDDASWEFTANVSRDIGPLGTRLQVQHSPDGSGTTKAWTWVEGRMGWDFTDRLEGTVAVGRREQDAAPDYTGWNAGLRYALTPSLDVDVRYHDTDADASNPQYAKALVASVTTYF